MDNSNDMDLNNNLLLSDLFLWDNTNNESSSSSSDPISSSTTSASLLDETFMFGEPSSAISNELYMQPNHDFLDLFSQQEKDFIINSNDSTMMLHHEMYNSNNGLVVEPFTDLDATQPKKIKKRASSQGKRKAPIEDESSLQQQEQQVDVKKPKKKRKRKLVMNVDPNAPPKPKRITGLNKPLILSASLQTIMDGATQLSRPEIVQRLWKYIKSNQLQDPADRRYILCDANLKNIFQQDRVNSFGMNRDLSAHLTKIETAFTTTTDATAAPVPPIQTEDFSPVPTAETPDIMTPSDTEGLQKWNTFI
ncbi:Transcriptional activator [Mucor velutinosus]|uniref:Transcriptional activator n=1 Tax=Mucor velutinosus TaxID=708070 RepID=A0AAN7DDU6_9FUNG|nr:Transcriptional activator [Mucor velutinosus]